jgi:hypothetical protein
VKHQFSMIALLFAGGAAAQIPQLNEASLSGRYHFVYGVYQRSQAQTTMGTLNFDGQGHYTAAAGSLTAQGSYHIDSDGTGSLTNPLDPLQPPLSLRLSAGSTMIGGSTLEQSVAYRHDLLLAISAGVQPPAIKGAWGGATFLYSPVYSRYRDNAAAIRNNAVFEIPELLDKILTEAGAETQQTQTLPVTFCQKTVLPRNVFMKTLHSCNRLGRKLTVER